MPAETNVGPVGDSRAARWSLRTVALAYLVLILLAPLVFIFYRTFEHGFDTFWTAVTSPRPRSTRSTSRSLITAITVPLNAIFGVAAALILVRRRVPARPLVSALIDLPLALSPVVVGLCIVLVWGQNGWFGGYAEDAGRPGAVRRARHGPRDHLRLPPVRGARGRPRAARGGHRPGGGRLDARAPARSRPSGASPSRRSAGASSTASSSRRPARSASTARWRSSPGRSRASTETLTLFVKQQYDQLGHGRPGRRLRRLGGPDPARDHRGACS